MTGMTSATFGQLLHRWRDRLAPRDAGITVTTRRRAPGLRREELAQLAGLSVDYVVRLEHDRAVRPSAQVVTALARALQLSRAERDQLFLSAGLLPPRDSTISTHIPAGVQRLLSRLDRAPIGVFAADWTLLSWNSAWTALHGDPAALHLTERNLARAIFGRGPAHAALRPSRSTSGDGFEISVVADLADAAARYPRDPGLTALIQDLANTSARFGDLWSKATPSHHGSERKTITHPVVGDITLDCDVLTVPGVDLRVVAYTVGAGTEDETKLDLLRVTGGMMTNT